MHHIKRYNERYNVSYKYVCAYLPGYFWSSLLPLCPGTPQYKGTSQGSLATAFFHWTSYFILYFLAGILDTSI